MNDLINLKKIIINLKDNHIKNKGFSNLLNSLKKIDTLKNLSSLEKKKKLLNFLTYKGWEKEMIYEKLNSF